MLRILRVCDLYIERALRAAAAVLLDVSGRGVPAPPRHLSARRVPCAGVRPHGLGRTRRQRALRELRVLSRLAHSR